MNTPRVLVSIIFALTAANSAFSGPINVVYQGSILETAPGVDQGLPIFLCQCLNNVRFKFFVPDYAALTNINSLNVSVDVWDDLANGFEQGSLLFVLNGIGQPNVTLNTFGSLIGYDETTPLTVPGTVGPGDMANALLEIQGDGIFFIRVNRRGNNAQVNDFYVTNPQVFLDGDLSVPEPSTMSLIGAGFAAALLGRRLRRA